MLRAIPLYFILLGIIINVHAQSITPAVISSIGDFSSGAEGSVSWTIGEPISGSYSNTSNSISTGMQQNDLFISSYINETPSSNYISTYPNPVANALQVNFSGMENDRYYLQLIGAAGFVVYKQTEQVTSDQHIATINFCSLPAGGYLLQISNSKGTFKAIKIQKY